ncbi:MAG: 4Fe-4S dicluster domain-containing protein [Deltaproteobacteria bacterium]|nr:4Fe-4S dicluster domain-containing protein [Deltaproteobacteria bacterium]
MKYWRKPLDMEQNRDSLGRVVIIEDRCKGCQFCITFCPRGVLRLSEKFNKKGYHYPEVIDASKCVNCTFCQVICPDFAIYVVDDNEDQQPPMTASEKEI